MTKRPSEPRADIITDPALRQSPDRLPGRRDGLPEGALGGMPADPQADENRDPPTETPLIPA